MMRLLVILFSMLVAARASFLECDSDETKVISSHVYDSSTNCSQIVAALPNLYQLQYRTECQRWLGLPALPDQVRNAYVSECYTFPRNDTIRYQAEVCCEGLVSGLRCITCNNVTLLNDTLIDRDHRSSYDCNYLGDVVTCAPGEVCQSSFEYYEDPSTNDSIAITLGTKSCAPASNCAARDANDVNTCKLHVPYPSCTECCNISFCNFHHDPPYYIPGGVCSFPNPCVNHGGTCTPDNSTTDGFRCDCIPGRFGKDCRKTACQFKHCKNNAYCRREVTPPYYTCYCSTGWTGPNCTEELAECSTNNCQNGGTCYDHLGFGTRCLCPDGYVGDVCQSKRPFDCPAVGGLAVLSWFKNILFLERNHTCDSWETLVSTAWHREAWLYYCDHHYGVPFNEGVDGSVTSLDAVHVHKCVHGDDSANVWYEACCPACLSSPCQNGGWCISTLTAPGYICRCRIRYEGINCEHEIATCFVSGDPHYSTFDKETIRFQGTCKYNMASSNATGLTPFNVLTKNERRYGGGEVSYVQYMEVLVYGHTIRLAQDSIVKVDGSNVSIPHQVTPKLKIIQNGLFVRVETDFSLAVEFDGDLVGIVKVAPEYTMLMKGLCGDFDGDASNDLTTSDGIDVSLDENKYTLVGNSWQVLDADDTSCTGPTTDPTVNCTGDLYALAESDEYCGLLTNLSGIFGPCISDVNSPASSYFTNCMYDVCANMPYLDVAKFVACGSLHSFARACGDMSYSLDWRQESNCLMNCSEGMEYSFHTSACPATCQNPDADTQCHLPETENCKCPDGELLYKGQCIPPENCSCVDNKDRQYRLGESWLSDDCTLQHSCIPCPSCTLAVHQITSTPHACLKGQSCISTSGGGSCTGPALDEEICKCAVHPDFRTKCSISYKGMKQTTCLAAGCCWLKKRGIPYCYVPRDFLVEPLPAPRTCRTKKDLKASGISFTKCGWKGIKDEEAACLGCCCDRRPNGTIWCYDYDDTTK